MFVKPHSCAQPSIVVVLLVCSTMAADLDSIFEASQAKWQDNYADRPNVMAVPIVFVAVLMLCIAIIIVVAVRG